MDIPRPESPFERLLANLFDYAGMFPPAALSFEEALETSGNLYETLRRPHLVASHMVVKPEQLPRLTAETLERHGYPTSQEMSVCLVGVGLADAIDEVVAIDLFHESHQRAKRARRVVSMEVTTKGDLKNQRAEIVATLERLQRSAESRQIRLFLEPRWTDDQWQEGMEPLIELLANLAPPDSSGAPPIGLKFRFAGPTAVAPQTAAAIIAQATAAGLRMKATQGLHHVAADDQRERPVGFLGLAVAVRMAIAQAPNGGLPVATIEQLLRLPNAKAVHQTPDGVACGEHVLAGDAFERALATPFTIGSCSLHEPDEELLTTFGPIMDTLSVE